jgi:hypothetical protein
VRLFDFPLFADFVPFPVLDFDDLDFDAFPPFALLSFLGRCRLSGPAITFEDARACVGPIVGTSIPVERNVGVAVLSNIVGFKEFVCIEGMTVGCIGWIETGIRVVGRDGAGVGRDAGLAVGVATGKVDDGPTTMDAVGLSVGKLVG